MKILNISDTEFRVTQPEYRLDDFYKTQLDKLKKLLEVAKSNKVDIIIHNGDFFSVPEASYNLLGDIGEILSENDIPFYCDVGSHDIIAYNMSTLNDTALGVLFRHKKIKIVEVLENKKMYVRFIRCRRNFKEEDYTVKDKDDKIKIVVSHDTVTDQYVRFEHVLVDDIKTNADLVLCGHYHNPFIIKKKKTLFVNPGSFTRQTKEEFNRLPHAVLIDTDDMSTEIINFSDKSNDKKIFNADKVKEEDKLKNDKESYINFIDSIKKIDASEKDISQVVDEIATKEHVSKEVKDEIIKRLLQRKENE